MIFQVHEMPTKVFIGGVPQGHHQVEQLTYKKILRMLMQINIKFCFAEDGKNSSKLTKTETNLKTGPNWHRK